LDFPSLRSSVHFRCRIFQLVEERRDLLAGEAEPEDLLRGITQRPPDDPPGGVPGLGLGQMEQSQGLRPLGMFLGIDYQVFGG
jgi:hypothetical protein